ncbi:MAG: gliding motility-associated C-terminal domain-containing protein, partial [Sphingobacteriales bacterium]
YTIQSMRMVVFNQWGEKVFESFNQATGWNGQYKGKGLPSGVYMYVCEMVLRDGTKQVKKGSINLVR